jgi:hypothetical protein
MNFSIRKRLLWTMLSTLLVLAVGASSVTYMRARSDINKLFDYEMEQMVYALAMHIASHPELTEEPAPAPDHEGKAGADYSGHLCCHHVVAAMPVTLEAFTDPSPSIYVSHLPVWPSLFSPEQQLRPPRG